MARSKRSVKEEDGEDDKDYEVESVITHKRNKDSLQYQVSWLGYPKEESSWLDEGEMKNAAAVVNLYWKSVSPKKKHERFKPGSKAARAAQFDSNPQENGSSARKRGSVPLERTPPKRVRSSYSKSESGSTPRRNKKGKFLKKEQDSEKNEEKVVNGMNEFEGDIQVQEDIQVQDNDDEGEEEDELGVEEEQEDNFELDEDNSLEGEEVPHPFEVKYQDVASWDDLVEKIDTVKNKKEELTFKIKWEQDEHPALIPLSVAKEKFPQKVIAFLIDKLVFKTSA